MNKCLKKSTGNKDNGLNKESRSNCTPCTIAQLSRTETLHIAYLMNVRIRESVAARSRHNGALRVGVRDTAYRGVQKVTIREYVRPAGRFNAD